MGNKNILFIIFILIMNLSVSVFADEQSDLEAALNVKNSEYTEIEEKIDDLKSQRKKITDEILKYNKELSDIQEHMDELETQRQELEKQLEEAQKNEDEIKKVYQNRLMSMYERNNIEVLDIFLNSDDIMEASQKLELIEQIAEYDSDLFLEVYEIKKNIIEKKGLLEQNVLQYDSEKSEFNSKIEADNSTVKEIDNEISNLEGQLEDIENDRTELNSKLYTYTYAGKVIQEGEKYLGYPYVWGGSTPETSFDCSGFVCWVMTNSGVYNLPRTTAQGIYDQCRKISADEAKAGDIIFFTGTYDAGEPVTHVGIYAGEGQMLHCGNPIQYTGIHSSYWESHFYAYGRLGNNE